MRRGPKEIKSQRTILGTINTLYIIFHTICVQLPGKVQFGRGHVDIDRTIIHDDNPNQALGEGRERGGRAGVTGQGGGGREIQSNKSQK